MVKLLHLQLQKMVHFGFVVKNQGVSSGFGVGWFWFWGEKPRSELLYVYESCSCVSCKWFGNLPGYVWSKTQRKIIMDDPSSYVLSEIIPASSGNGETYLKDRDRYVDMEWCAVNEKSRKMVRIKTVCFTAVRRKTLVIYSNGSNKNPV